MDAERWKRLNELFHATLERDPEARESFLTAAAADDPSLGDEVRSLVAAHAMADVFERPAYEQDPGMGSTDHREDLKAGERLGPYQIEKLLGRGGMGIVYLARDTRLARPVALKALPAAFTDDEAYRARLRREAMTAASLVHPGIATIFALEEFDGRVFLIREYVEGRTLRDELRDGPLPMARLVSVAAAVADALAAAHAEGVIHRDLKPENVMRASNGGIKVLDFGLARFAGGDDRGSDRLTLAGAVPGTPGYISPEQLRGDAVDFRADQFSFGVLVYELLTGRHPFDADDRTATVARVLDAAPPSIRSIRSDCPERLERIVGRCLAKRPSARYESTQSLAQELAALRDGAALPDRVAGIDRSPSSWRSRPAAVVASSLWWWQFHQVAISAIHALTLYLMWHAREWLPDEWGAMMFIAAVAVVGVSATLRLHLCFTSRIYPAELRAQRRHAAPWTRRADAAFAIVLVAAALLIANAHAEWAAFLIVIAIISIVSGEMIEPATTRAAFSAE